MTYSASDKKAIANTILESENDDSIIEAVYKIDNSDVFRDEKIIEKLRSFLENRNNDLVEITIMRLALRLSDIYSLDKFIDILKSNKDTLVQTAAISAIASLGSKFDSCRDKCTNALEEIAKSPKYKLSVRSLAMDELNSPR